VTDRNGTGRSCEAIPYRWATISNTTVARLPWATPEHISPAPLPAPLPVPLPVQLDVLLPAPFLEQCSELVPVSYGCRRAATWPFAFRRGQPRVDPPSRCDVVPRVCSAADLTPRSEQRTRAKACPRSAAERSQTDRDISCTGRQREAVGADFPQECRPDRPKVDTLEHCAQRVPVSQGCRLATGSGPALLPWLPPLLLPVMLPALGEMSRQAPMRCPMRLPGALLGALPKCKEAIGIRQ
jgi:hypothetical protein